MKVSEMSGATLDLWVAKALGDREARIVGVEEHERCETRFGGQWPWNRFMPSGAWMDGGPIIEREKIGINTWTGDWCAQFTFPVKHPTNPKRDPSHHCMRGETPLIAAMRTYVSSRFGEEVPD